MAQYLSDFDGDAPEAWQPARNDPWKEESAIGLDPLSAWGDLADVWAEPPATADFSLREYYGGVPIKAEEYECEAEKRRHEWCEIRYLFSDGRLNRVAFRWPGDISLGYDIEGTTHRVAYFWKGEG